MTSLNLPPIEDLDVDDLASLPAGYRYARERSVSLSSLEEEYRARDA